MVAIWTIVADDGFFTQYLVVTLGDARQSTPTIPKTLNPEWNVTFEMPVVGVPLLECICWDHDRFGKDYLGEFDIPLEDIFYNGDVHQQVGIRPPQLKPSRADLNPEAEMVYTQVEAETDKEEGQYGVRGDSSTVFNYRCVEPNRPADRDISEI